MKWPDVHTERPCKYCGKMFAPKNSKHVFCSGRCHRAWMQAAKRKQATEQEKKNFREQTVLPEEYVRIREMRTWDRTEENEDEDFEQSEPLPTRFCHDCGKPTTDYRCAECWEKFKRKYAANYV